MSTQVVEPAGHRAQSATKANGTEELQTLVPPDPVRQRQFPLVSLPQSLSTKQAWQAALSQRALKQSPRPVHD
jgi:hypothetical protein